MGPFYIVLQHYLIEELVRVINIITLRQLQNNINLRILEAFVQHHTIILPNYQEVNRINLHFFIIQLSSLTKFCLFYCCRSLSGNIWQCDCGFLWLRDWLQRWLQSGNTLLADEHFVCYTPQSLFGSHVMSLNEDKFQCGRCLVLIKCTVLLNSIF